MPKFSDQELKEIQNRTEKIEAERDARRQEKEELKRQKELKKQRATREKFVGPLLLILTIIITLLLKLFFKQ